MYFQAIFNNFLIFNSFFRVYRMHNWIFSADKLGPVTGIGINTFYLCYLVISLQFILFIIISSHVIYRWSSPGMPATFGLYSTPQLFQYNFAFMYNCILEKCCLLVLMVRNMILFSFVYQDSICNRNHMLIRKVSELHF